MLPPLWWPMLRSRGQNAPTLLFDITDKSCWLGRQESEAALRGPTARLSRLKRSWCATDAAATFVLTLLRLGWSAQSARHLTTHDGTTIDLLAAAPKTLGFLTRPLWCGQTAQHIGEIRKGRFSGESPRLCSLLRSWKGGTLTSQRAGQAGFAIQDRLSRLRGWEDNLCQLFKEGPGTMFHRCDECPTLKGGATSGAFS